MKKISLKIFIAIMSITFAFSACSKGGFGDTSSSNGISSETENSSDINSESKDTATDEVPDIISVFSKPETITIKSVDVLNYDYTTLFRIRVNGAKIAVLDEYIDSSAIKDQPGEYKVTCEYRGEKAVCTVIVPPYVYELKLKQKNVELKASAVKDFDFKKYFSLTKDGISIDITDKMITNNVISTPGKYSYIVNAYGQTQSLEVTVKSDHDILIIPSYKNFKLDINLVDSFDYTSLFSLYVDSESVKVEKEMIDFSSLKEGVVGDIKQVKFSYTHGGNIFEETIDVTLVEGEKIIINSIDIQTYPNGKNIDLTQLFNITKGDKSVPVTIDMITGNIDYSKTGDNIITINYEGQTAKAIVKVVSGVVINHPHGKIITIEKGTDINTYPFHEDFEVVINGIEFADIYDKIDFSKVNFEKSGTYNATIKIRYSQKIPDPFFGDINDCWEFFEKTIAYKVLENDYDLVVKENIVNLPKGTTTYDVYSNINLRINDMKQKLTENPDHEGPVACYVKTISKPIDFKSPELQEVVIELYVNGKNEKPIIAKYQVAVESDINIECHDSVVFYGKTFYATNIFKITDNGKNVNVTFDMVSGKVDTFRPGIYTVEIEYKKHRKVANVTVLEESLKGTYKTTLTTYDSSKGTTSEIEENVFVKKILGDLVISEINGKLNIKVGEYEGQVIGVEDGNNILIQVKNNIFRMNVDNGIAVLIPVDRTNMKYNNERRPLIYFNDSNWETQEHITINSIDDYVLENNYMCYSIDTIKLKNKKTNDISWYGFKVEILEKVDSDYYYDVTYGEVEYPKDFKAIVGERFTVNFLDKKYNFVLKDKNTGKIESKDKDISIIDNKVFNGFINGIRAKLHIQNGTFILNIDGKEVLKVSQGEVLSMQNGGVNGATVLLYNAQLKNNIFYSYKFNLDVENKTFEYIQPDNLKGLYVYNNQFVFIDGYGSGYINFDTKWFYKTEFAYTMNGNIMDVKFQFQRPSFSYGKGGKFYVDEFLNKLTAHGFNGGISENVVFENIYITKGAIVDIENMVVGKDTIKNGKMNFLNGITIKTKDGILNNTEKENLVNLDIPYFSESGFYKFSISVYIDGKEVEKNYSLQVLDDKFIDNPIVRVYSKGVIHSNSLSIDKYGIMTLITSKGAYKGSVSLKENNRFIAYLYSKNNDCVFADGKIVQDGTLNIQFSGIETFSDIFTVNENKAVGNEKYILRYYKNTEGIKFFLSMSPTDSGREVQVSLIEGESILSNNSTLQITRSDGSIIKIKVVKWENSFNGIEILEQFNI